MRLVTKKQVIDGGADPFENLQIVFAYHLNLVLGSIPTFAILSFSWTQCLWKYYVDLWNYVSHWAFQNSEIYEIQQLLLKNKNVAKKASENRESPRSRTMLGLSMILWA